MIDICFQEVGLVPDKEKEFVIPSLEIPNIRAIFNIEKDKTKEIVRGKNYFYDWFLKRNNIKYTLHFI